MHVMGQGSDSEIRRDCEALAAVGAERLASLAKTTIAVTGGTGFLGTWLAEMIAVLNDQFKLAIQLHLYARNPASWQVHAPHLAKRNDIHCFTQDVRSAFDFEPNTQFIIHAAGIPDGRVHVSDPLRVHQTIVQGTSHVLSAASHLSDLRRVLNVSSCLVNGASRKPGAQSEADSFAIESGSLGAIYADAKRSSESLTSIFRSQLRLPITTIRPFTFTGAYQDLERPWAVNNFLRDALAGRDIRIHGSGTARRSYLHGSDAAWWLLLALVHGRDGDVLNMGGTEPIEHLELARLVGSVAGYQPQIIINTLPSKAVIVDDLFPDLKHTKEVLGFLPKLSLKETIEKTYRWFRSKSSA
jgi:nucleoside-diphosphate-sugar epimerase